MIYTKIIVNKEQGKQNDQKYEPINSGHQFVY